MEYNDFVTNIANADTDAQALSKFMQGLANEIVKRRIAGDTKTLNYYLDFLRGLELVYSQQTGEVDVNGVKVKTVTQAIKDAISAAGVANGVNANLVSYNNRTQADKNNDTVSVFDYFTKDEKSAYDTNNAIDATAAVQRAINSGKNIDLVGRTFYVNNLTQTVSGQSIVSSQGIAKLIKNANGSILTSTASYGFVMHNINWRGNSSTPTYTGDGVVATGDQPQFINCGGRWISGRALKATGGHVTILGTCDIYQTTDTTADGYDIEIGKSGTSTLYHQLISVYTGQKTGGILLVDTGSHSLHGGQFGKLSIKAGTKPSGVNGGITIGARILGDVTVEQSNATFTSNQFDAVNITFANGTSYCSLDASNIINADAVIVNNGNKANNLIQRNYGTGADGTFKVAFGDDSNKRVMSYSLSDMTKAYQFDGSVVIPNAQTYKSYASDGTTLYNLLSVSSNNTVQIGAATGQYTYINGTNVGINSTSGTQVRVSDGFIAPFSDNSKFLGTASLRWQHSYIVNAHFFPLSSVAPSANGEVMLELTNDTTLKFKVKGSDGVVRSASLTLA